MLERKFSFLLQEHLQSGPNLDTVNKFDQQLKRTCGFLDRTKDQLNTYDFQSSIDNHCNASNPYHHTVNKKKNVLTFVPNIFLLIQQATNKYLKLNYFEEIL